LGACRRLILALRRFGIGAFSVAAGLLVRPFRMVAANAFDVFFELVVIALFGELVLVLAVIHNRQFTPMPPFDNAWVRWLWSKHTLEISGSRSVGLKPGCVPQEAVNLVRYHDLLERHAREAQALDEIHHLMELDVAIVVALN
jgi:hypothetical protein